MDRLQECQRYACEIAEEARAATCEEVAATLWLISAAWRQIADRLDEGGASPGCDAVAPVQTFAIS